MIDNKKLKTTLTTNFQLPKQVNQAKEEAFAKIKASKVSEATETEVSSIISSASETDFTSNQFLLLKRILFPNRILLTRLQNPVTNRTFTKDLLR